MRFQYIAWSQSRSPVVPGFKLLRNEAPHDQPKKHEKSTHHIQIIPSLPAIFHHDHHRCPTHAWREHPVAAAAATAKAMVEGLTNKRFFWIEAAKIVVESAKIWI